MLHSKPSALYLALRKTITWRSLVFGLALAIAGCGAQERQTSSSSNSFSSSSSSSTLSSSSESSSSSSSVDAGPLPIIPRTSCPTPPPTPDYGSWPANYAEAAYPSSHDTVRNFKELMVDQGVFDETGIDLPWNLHTPYQAENNPDQLYPLVIYLHGGAERGRDPSAANVHLNNRHAKNFFASSNSLLTDEHQAEFPAYILAPLCDCNFGSNEWSSWGGAKGKMGNQASRYGAAVIALIEKLIAEKQVDPARIYVTGPSMGGAGSWELAIRRPDLIAAAIPLAGHPPSDTDLAKLGNSKVAVWAQTGDGDYTNPFADVVNASEYVSGQGGCAWTSLFPKGQPEDDPADADPSDVAHNIWARAYTNPDLWPWVFSIEQPRGELAGLPNWDDSLASNNHYDAPLSDTAPTIDGFVDDAWDAAPWMLMDQAWTDYPGENLTEPSSPLDFSGRYKAMWDEGYLYLLLQIIDEKIDAERSEYWQKDTVEIFIDEDASGGQHNYSYNAFAYHISYSLDVYDSVDIEDHLDVDLNTLGNSTMWELRIELRDEQNQPVAITADKTIGFSPSYIDNDGQSREHFMSSVYTEGHNRNQGYLDASVFGTLTFVE